MTSLCVTCRFAEWDRTKLGRLHPNGQGRCSAPSPVIPKLSAAFWWSTFSRTEPTILGGIIERHYPIPECPVFEQKEK